MARMPPEELFERMESTSYEPGSHLDDSTDPSKPPPTSRMLLGGLSSPLSVLRDRLGSDAVLVEVDGTEPPEWLEARVVEVVGKLRDFGVDVQADVQVGFWGIV